MKLKIHKWLFLNIYIFFYHVKVYLLQSNEIILFFVNLSEESINYNCYPSYVNYLLK